MGNRQFPGAMATADWYNRFALVQKEERRDEQNERATEGKKERGEEEGSLGER